MTTTKLAITEMTASQSQKHVTFNEALFTLDNLVQLSVLDKDLTAPPGSPSTGDSYIVAGVATGDWLGKENNVASYDGDGWIFFEPNDGWFCWVDDEAEIYFYDSGWSALGDILGSGYAPLAGATFTGTIEAPLVRGKDTEDNSFSAAQTLGEFAYGTGSGYRSMYIKGPDTNDAGDAFQFTTANAFKFLVDSTAALTLDQAGRVGLSGATPDASNPFAVNGVGALFNSTGSYAFKVNKNASGNDASFAFQQGFTSYAQLGLLGNNDFTIKVGTGSTTALVADEATGAVELTQHPKFSAYCNYDAYIAANTWTTVPCNNTRHNDQGAFDAATNNDFTAPHDGYYTFGAGFTLKENATVPTEIRVGLSINGAAPTEDRSLTFADTYNGTGTLITSINITALLKLSASDTVEMQVYMATNDGYVEADSNHFWGHQVP